MPHSPELDTPHGRRRKSQRDPLIGTMLDDRFLIEARIATGGFGAIYRARTTDGALVALKVLHPQLTCDPNMVARFRREGATMTQLHDPHTVTTLAVGETSDGTLYIAMELLSGESLHDRLTRNGSLPWQTAVVIARAVCSSLAEAHALGVVHRDLKPENIHVEAQSDGSDAVKVLDFGIVKIATGSSIDDGKQLTCAGYMIGTYDYMSPEQIVGAPCSDLSDIYSLGVVIYEMLTGRRPFAQITGPAAMMTALLTQTPSPPSLIAAIPPELDRIVMRCLEREPEHRFRNILELAGALDRLLARRACEHEAVTVVQPAYDPGAMIADEERTWINLERSTIPELGRSRATSHATSECMQPWAMPMVDALGAMPIIPPARRIATGTGPQPKTSPEQVAIPAALPVEIVELGSGPVAQFPLGSRPPLEAAPTYGYAPACAALYAPSCAPSLAPPGALYTTLPGIAVATTPRTAHDAHPALPGARATPSCMPLGWQPVPHAGAWIPAPSVPAPSVPAPPSMHAMPLEQLAGSSSPELPSRPYRVLWIASAIGCLAALVLSAVI